MNQDDQDMAELARQLKASRDSGFDALCLLGCGQGFNGPDCPRCWPPTRERMVEAGNFFGSVWDMRAASVYAWICGRLGATRNETDQSLWMAVRAALDAAVTGSTWKP